MFIFLQRVFFFPLKARMKALLSTPKYWEMCQHEFTRPRNPHILSDVYDGTAWKSFMGECTYPNRRLGLLACGDGWPVFEANTLSLTPWMFQNLSLPPAARIKPKYILLYWLFDQGIKQEQQRKYFDFAASYELNDLYDNGIDGVKVKVFTATLDTKGREDVSGTCACQ